MRETSYFWAMDDDGFALPKKARHPMTVRMKWIAFLSLILLTASMGCEKVSSGKDLENIKELEEAADAFRKELVPGAPVEEMQALVQLEAAYVAFADHYPDAAETPEFLFRAAEINGNELGKVGPSIKLYERIANGYPQSKSAPTALFLAGYAYHNTLHDLIRAEKSFRQFLETYPGHELAPIAQQELSTLGKPVKDILEALLEHKEGEPHFLKDTSGIQ